MKLALLFSWMVAAAAVGFAQDRPAAEISPEFPPADDIRQPDRTLPRAGPGPAAVLAYSPEGRLLATAGGDNL
ncbi:MAG TPA: hypothetical protein VFB27_13015, partial [Opitutaceae bacterium]|nr:hypothetical protein [Opitutaceae bacterium]